MPVGAGGVECAARRQWCRCERQAACVRGCAVPASVATALPAFHTPRQCPRLDEARCKVNRFGAAAAAATDGGAAAVIVVDVVVLARGCERALSLLAPSSSSSLLPSPLPRLPVSVRRAHLSACCARCTALAHTRVRSVPRARVRACVPRDAVARSCPRPSPSCPRGECSSQSCPSERVSGKSRNVRRRRSANDSAIKAAAQTVSTSGRRQRR